MANNWWNDRDVSNLNCYDWREVAIAGGFGAIGGGAGRVLGGGLRYGARTLTRETGLEWSHSVGRKWVNSYTSGKWNKVLNARGGLNGRWVTPERHFRHDPHRWLKGGVKAWGPKVRPWLQPIDRIPEWLRGIGAGAALGAAIGEADSQ